MPLETPARVRGFSVSGGQLVRLKSCGLWLCTVAVWSLAFLAFYHVLMVHVEKPDANPFAVVGAGAALLALAGWMVQAWISLRNSRRQHSINVLFQSRMSPEFHRHAKVISAQYPGMRKIFHDDISRAEQKEVYDAVAFVLNYYEFIAVGIAHRDLDEAVMRDCIRSNMIAFCHRVDDVIRHIRKEDDNGRPHPEKAVLLKALRKLERRWRKQYYRQTGCWPFFDRKRDSISN